MVFDLLSMVKLACPICGIIIEDPDDFQHHKIIHYREMDQAERERRERQRQIEAERIRLLQRSRELADEFARLAMRDNSRQ